MAARNVKIRHDEETRSKIRATQLLNRLQDHALGEVDMSSTQVRAAEIALRKVLPDLTATEHSGEIANSNVIRAPVISTTTKTWAAQHVPEQHRTEH